MATKLEKAIDWGSAVNTDDQVIRYYFHGAGENVPFGNKSAGWTAREKKQVERAFDIFETFLDIEFKKVGNKADADFRFGTNKGSEFLGFMFPPGEGNKSGYGEFNKLGEGWKDGLGMGGFGFKTIIHEIGHGLGLAHPHDKGGKSTKFPGVTSEFGDFGKHKLNQGIYTMMSYNDGWTANPKGQPPSYKYGYEGTPMAIDIVVLQAKYGANMDYKTGDNTYKLPKSNGPGTFYSAIWDAGGEDTIVYNGGRPASIDLREATLKVEPGGGGFLSYSKGVHGGFTIANGVVIENARGGKGNDHLSGNSADNTISGGKGKDILKGRKGDDTLNGDAGSDVLDGGTDADKLKGGKGADRVKGKDGADFLNGGAGSDKLTGGKGKDIFAFKDKFGSGADEITDFKPGSDLIQLDKSVFKNVGPVGDLAASAFRVASKVKDADDRIIYKKSTGALLYDGNGDASGGQKKFAMLESGLNLSHEDFMIVA
ncbi:M10 family metallopeptidase C-terminal domain-containing protein [Bauldia sp.]|uniref:M10 family metallopeptidase C-terminal domain-containing protein n=1 Tax=Bauldia sp. TaxID=2575872 RepID=UPI003BACB2B2